MAGFLKNLLKGVLIGGGSILAALCPPAGGAVITAGMAIGTGAMAAGNLINPGGSNSVDPTVNAINNWLQMSGLQAPATTTTGFLGLTTKTWMLILGVLGFVLIIFKRR